jgi:predicted ribosomally synthesized peptide with nif11-like leader
MSEDQFKLFLEAVKADGGLQERFKGATDLDSFAAIAQDSGFDVCIADVMKHQSSHAQDLSDEELQEVSGGGITFPFIMGSCWF